jgi:small subunit ribosomal protein S9
MADQENPETPEGSESEQQAGEGHAVPSEEATEIAGVVEDAALEAFQEAEEKPDGAVAPEPPTVQAAGEGHAVPSEEAMEIAGVIEDAPLEALQEAEDRVAEQAAVDEEEEEPTPRAKPSVPGAHLEVDIVPEGVDPLGRGQDYEDLYASEDDAEQTEQGEEELQETLTEPISTAAIDLASGARYRATGKRKTAIARVTLRPGTGTYLVNGRSLETHFPRLTLQRNIRQPLETVGYQERMDVVARLHGGGISAQAGALRHGVSRALLEADPNLRGELKRRGFLTRDSRAKERKKAGLKKARKRPQFSKR